MPGTHWAFLHPFQLRLQRGIEAYLSNLTSALVENRIDADILTWAGPLKMPQNKNRQDISVKIQTVPSIRYYQRVFAIPFYLWHLVSSDYDHLFINFAGYGEGETLDLLRRFRTIPFSIVFHFPRSLVPHRYQEFARWGLQRQAHQLIAVSHYVADQVEAWAERQCAVIGHGVNTQHFRPEPLQGLRIRSSLAIKKDAPMLVTTAALEARKGIQWGIRALPTVLQTHPDTHYIVLGEGDYRNHLENLIQDLQLENRVHLLGAVSDVAPYLNAADIALLLSREEASPVALLEYAASALPILTAAHPPFDELVKPEWGIMIDETATDEVAQTITSLLSDLDKRSTMGAAARDWAKSDRSWNHIAEQYQTLIGQVRIDE